MIQGYDLPALQDEVEDEDDDDGEDDDHGRAEPEDVLDLQRKRGEGDHNFMDLRVIDKQEENPSIEPAAEASESWDPSHKSILECKD